MGIKTREDYKYVDRKILKHVDVQGKPFPLRGYRGYVTSEDLVFLQETVKERLGYTEIYSTEESVTRLEAFARKIEAAVKDHSSEARLCYHEYYIATDGRRYVRARAYDPEKTNAITSEWTRIDGHTGYRTEGSYPDDQAIIDRIAKERDDAIDAAFREYQAGLVSLEEEADEDILNKKEETEELISGEFRERYEEAVEEANGKYAESCESENKRHESEVERIEKDSGTGDKVQALALEDEKHRKALDALLIIHRADMIAAKTEYDSSVLGAKRDLYALMELCAEKDVKASAAGVKTYFKKVDEIEKRYYNAVANCDAYEVGIYGFEIYERLDKMMQDCIIGYEKSRFLQKFYPYFDVIDKTRFPCKKENISQAREWYEKRMFSGEFSLPWNSRHLLKMLYDDIARLTNVPYNSETRGGEFYGRRRITTVIRDTNGKTRTTTADVEEGYVFGPSTVYTYEQHHFYDKEGKETWDETTSRTEPIDLFILVGDRFTSPEEIPEIRADVILTAKSWQYNVNEDGDKRWLTEAQTETYFKKRIKFKYDSVNHASQTQRINRLTAAMEDEVFELSQECDDKIREIREKWNVESNDAKSKCESDKSKNDNARDESIRKVRREFIESSYEKATAANTKAAEDPDHANEYVRQAMLSIGKDEIELNKEIEDITRANDERNKKLDEALSERLDEINRSSGSEVASMQSEYNSRTMKVQSDYRDRISDIRREITEGIGFYDDSQLRYKATISLDEMIGLIPRYPSPTGGKVSTRGSSISIIPFQNMELVRKPRTGLPDPEDE